MTQATTDFDSATRAFYDDLDANDPGTFQRHLAPGAVFAFNDVDPVTGVQQISDFVGAWKGNFKSVTHGIAAIAGDPGRGTAAIELVVSYIFPDDREVKVVLHGERLSGQYALFRGNRNAGQDWASRPEM